MEPDIDEQEFFDCVEEHEFVDSATAEQHHGDEQCHGEHQFAEQHHDDEQCDSECPVAEQHHDDEQYDGNEQEFLGCLKEHEFFDSEAVAQLHDDEQWDGKHQLVEQQCGDEQCEGECPVIEQHHGDEQYDRNEQEPDRSWPIEAEYANDWTLEGADKPDCDTSKASKDTESSRPGERRSEVCRELVLEAQARNHYFGGIPGLLW